jgi:mRNA interferase RelE/StbE
MDRIEKLETNPRPVGIEPLQGAEVGLFRIRQGDYRIVYSIQDKKLLVLVVRVVHRNRSIRRNIRSERAEYACIYSSQAYLYARATSNA